MIVNSVWARCWLAALVVGCIKIEGSYGGDLNLRERSSEIISMPNWPVMGTVLVCCSSSEINFTYPVNCNRGGWLKARKVNHLIALVGNR